VLHLSQFSVVAARLRGPASMAVGAPDIAFLDLSEDVRPIGVVPHEVNDRSPLVGSMVELENDGVGFAAIDARMRQEIVQPLALCIDRREIGGRV
jgi:hypothetical protein